MSEYRVTHELRLVHETGLEEPVSEHTSFAESWAAGQEAVHANRASDNRLYGILACKFKDIANELRITRIFGD
jgi:hypothetical protein